MGPIIRAIKPLSFCFRPSSAFANIRVRLATLIPCFSPQSEARLGNYQAGFFLGSRCASWRTVTNKREVTQLVMLQTKSDRFRVTDCRGMMTKEWEDVENKALQQTGTFPSWSANCEDIP
jgi:hypothetical protein